MGNFLLKKLKRQKKQQVLFLSIFIFNKLVKFIERYGTETLRLVLQAIRCSSPISARSGTD